MSRLDEAECACCALHWGWVTLGSDLREALTEAPRHVCGSGKPDLSRTQYPRGVADPRGHPGTGAERERHVGANRPGSLAAVLRVGAADLTVRDRLVLLPVGGEEPQECLSLLWRGVLQKVIESVERVRTQALALRMALWVLHLLSQGLHVGAPARGMCSFG